MRLFELSITQKDKKYQDDRRHIMNFMENKGFHLLGSGSYAFVFGHENNPHVAYKVFFNDPCYLKWINFCMAHQNNKHIPKIYSKLIKMPTKDYYAIKIEMLNHYDIPTDESDAFINFDTESPFWNNEMEQIMNFIKTSNCGDDLAYTNIMHRDDGTLVVTDPIAE